MTPIYDELGPPMISLNSQIVRKLLDFFFNHEDERLYVNEIARRVGLDKRNLVKKLKELESDGIFSVEAMGNLRLYSLNRKFPLYKEYKKIVLRTVGFEEKLRGALREVVGIEKAWIYGSYAHGRTDASSDIDVLVVGRHDGIELQKRIARLQKDYDREINVMDMSGEEFEKKRGDPFIKAIMEGEKIELL